MTSYYEDDLVTLYHGDCLSDEILPLWLAADVLVTDPPYGIGYRAARSSGRNKDDRRERSRALAAEGKQRIAADRDVAARDAVLERWPPDSPGLVFGHWRAPRPSNVRQRLLWVKSDPGTGLSGHPWVTKDEEIYVIGRTQTQFLGPARSGVYVTPEGRSAYVKKIGHPTPKPVGLMEALLTKCPPGTIADPFAGSGSTLVAAKQLGRRAIGVELEERYCEIAARRLSQGVLDFDEPIQLERNPA